MEKNTKVIIAGVIVLIILGVGIYLYQQKSAVAPPSGASVTEPTTPTGGGATPIISPTKALTPKDIKVPEEGEKTSQGVATPTNVIAASPTTDAKLRFFEIKADKNKFEPQTIIVNRLDLIDIKLTAVDKEYDITIPDFGIFQKANKGETKPIQFQATAEGKYTYYCNSCGGLKSGAIGYIIVK